MSEIDKTVKEHLVKLLEDLQPNPPQELIDQAENAWLEKLDIFTSQCLLLKMVETHLFPADDKNGLLALTYSGSLVALYPEKNGRKMEYASLKLRTDIPGFVNSEAAGLVRDVQQGAAIHLENSKIQHTSAVYKIMAFTDETEFSDQANRLNEAMIYLTGNFIKLNRSTISITRSDLDQFDMKSIVRFIASRLDMTQNDTKNVIKEYLGLIDGALSIGENVRLGQLGSIKLVKKSPRKARVLNNLQTGKEIIIPASGETMGAKMVFSKNLKEKIKRLDPANF
ncbi:MAG: HU family DNA-binding protein [Spirochaetales bacterium]|nr:HU family DNA-binding protein [Spirochaetales bacterium]